MEFKKIFFSSNRTTGERRLKKGMSIPNTRQLNQKRMTRRRTRRGKRRRKRWRRRCPRRTTTWRTTLRRTPP